MQKRTKHEGNLPQTQKIMFQSKEQQKAQQKQQKSIANNAQITCQMNLAVKCTESEKYKNRFLKQKSLEFFLFKKIKMANRDMPATHPHNTG